MRTMLELRCPKCNASLSVKNDKEFAFCQYCGTKIIISNENEHIYRTIDEAGIKQAETERIVKLKQLDLEEKSNNTKKLLIIVWISVTMFFLLLGIVGFIVESDGLIMCLLLGMCVGLWGGLGLALYNKKDSNG